MSAKLYRLARLRNRYLFLIDVLVVSLTPTLAIAIRLESIASIFQYASPLALFTVATVCTKILIFERNRLYTYYWAYASSDELAALLQAVSIGMVAELLLSYAILYPLGILPLGFPRSIPIINSLLTTLLVGGERLSIRLLFSMLSKKHIPGSLNPVIVVGAGAAGTMIVKELQTNFHLGLAPVGYVDDDPGKQGLTIHGVKVLGKLSDLLGVAGRTGAREAIVAMPTAPGLVVREVVSQCKSAGIQTKTVPGIFEILRGSARVEQIRNVQIEDLLRRGTVKTDTTLVASIVKGARIMITGAGGSIGSELCRQIKEFQPAELILLGHGENSICSIARELRALRRPRLAIRSVIGDIRDRDRMHYVFRRYRPELIFHAAAHKHVDLMQSNVIDAVTNNVLGTRNLVDLAMRDGVKRFVMISSDKAVNPTSVMGATKRVAELIVRSASAYSECAFMTVRFGNVLGSRGSVVPIFQQQINTGGPVTVTHPDVKRYFMTIPEAVQLVLLAGAMGKGGEIFVLDMGEQIKVLDIAKDLIRLSGLEEGTDIRIEFIGLLSGEKMYEELFYADEEVEHTSNEKILVCRNGLAMRNRTLSRDDNLQPQEILLSTDLDTLIEAAKLGSLDLVHALLRRIVPQYTLPEEMFTAAACMSERVVASPTVFVP
jgi:FlaA1/EpsC-like NDP-sugar epimerase